MKSRIAQIEVTKSIVKRSIGDTSSLALIGQYEMHEQSTSFDRRQPVLSSTQIKSFNETLVTKTTHKLKVSFKPSSSLTSKIVLGQTLDHQGLCQM